MQDLINTARANGELSAGHFRAVCVLGDQTLVRDFDDLQRAAGYADDVVSEGGAGPAAGVVVDHGFEVVHRARPYFG